MTPRPIPKCPLCSNELLGTTDATKLGIGKYETNNFHLFVCVNCGFPLSVVATVKQEGSHSDADLNSVGRSLLAIAGICITGELWLAAEEALKAYKKLDTPNSRTDVSTLTYLMSKLMEDRTDSPKKDISEKGGNSDTSSN